MIVNMDHGTHFFTHSTCILCVIENITIHVQGYGEVVGQPEGIYEERCTASPNTWGLWQPAFFGGKSCIVVAMATSDNRPIENKHKRSETCISHFEDRGRLWELYHVALQRTSMDLFLTITHELAKSTPCNWDIYVL